MGPLVPAEGALVLSHLLGLADIPEQMDGVDARAHRSIGVQVDVEQGLECIHPRISKPVWEDPFGTPPVDGGVRSFASLDDDSLVWSSLCFLSLCAVALAALTFIFSLCLIRLSSTLPRLHGSSTSISIVRISPTQPSRYPENAVYIENVNEDLGTPSWENLRAAEHCLRYATRQYTAKLANVASDASGVKTCRETPAEIHGVSLLPDFCQDLGLAGGIWGYWTIAFEEPECLTSWRDFIDKGCDDQGKELMTRRFEAALENMRSGDDWQIMCTTTPAELKGFHFPTPTMCENWGQEGVWGIWEIDDLTCLSS